MNCTIIIHTVLYSLLLTTLLFGSEDYNDNWPNWRGPNANGVSITAAPPIEWSESKNVKWKIPIPGKGLSTPVIWGDHIFITTAIELDKKATEEAIKRFKKSSPAILKLLRMSKTTEHFLQFVVYSISRKNGETTWKKVVREQYPHEGVQVNASWASQSCVTDGKYIIASFGSYGVYCFTMDGNLIWEKDLGDMHIEAAWGEASSPVLYKDEVIIVWDHEGQSKIFALNKITGDVIWTKDRDEATTWATPVVAEIDDIGQIIVNGKKISKAYNCTNGEIIWQNTGLDGDVIASPVLDGNMVFLMTGGMSGNKIIQAIDLTTAKGNLEKSNSCVWTYNKKTPYIPSPLVSNGKLYFLKSSSCCLSCANTKTGKIYYEGQKAEGMKGAYASPVIADKKIYIIDRKGTCSIIKTGTEFEVIAHNKLDDNFDASPAVAGKELILRGFKNMYCIAE